MVETATTTTITRTTATVPVGNQVNASVQVSGGNGGGGSSSRTAASQRQNEELSRGIYNLKQIAFLLLLPVILFAVFLKHLLDYLFALGQKEKDVSGKVALVSKPTKKAHQKKVEKRNFIWKCTHTTGFFFSPISLSP